MSSRRPPRQRLRSSREVMRNPGGVRQIITTAFIAGNTKLLPRPQQRAKNTHKGIMP